jgi:hypothetical protein
MITAAENDGRCANCASTREACDARTDSWPRYCCPACQQTPAWRTHVVGDREPRHDGPRLLAPMVGCR